MRPGIFIFVFVIIYVVMSPVPVQARKPVVARAKTVNAPAVSAGWDLSTDGDFASVMCEDGFYFRTCFDTARASCEAAVREETKNCAKSFAKGPVAKGSTAKGSTAKGGAAGPPSSRRPATDQSAPRAQDEKESILRTLRIGMCVGGALERRWKNKKSTATKCDSQEHWQ